MATPKSADERIKRKIRLKKPHTPHDDHDLPGRIAVKKTGNNDPRRNKPKLTAESFMKFYKGESVAPDVELTMVMVEKLIKFAMHFEGKFPFKIARLTEMRESLKNTISEEVEEPAEYTATFEISSRKEDVIKGVWRMLRAAEMLGGMGASRTLCAFVDGDGAFQMKLKATTAVDEIDEINVNKIADKEEIHIDMFGGKITGVDEDLDKDD